VLLLSTLKEQIFRKSNIISKKKKCFLQKYFQLISSLVETLKIDGSDKGDIQTGYYWGASRNRVGGNRIVKWNWIQIPFC